MVLALTPGEKVTNSQYHDFKEDECAGDRVFVHYNRHQQTIKLLWMRFDYSGSINASGYGVSDCGIIDSNKPIHCYELDLISLAKEHSWINHERKECLQSGWMSRRWSTHISTFWDSSSCSLSDADQSDVWPAKRLHYVLSTVRMATGIERFYNLVEALLQVSSDKKRTIC